MNELLGRRLGPFEIVEEIGRGGMGVIYRAVQYPLQREVALKVMSPLLGHDPEFVQRFIREAQIAARLSHPNIVYVYDQGQIDGYLYIVMEYVNGLDLGAVLEQRGSLPVSETLALVQQICQALAYAHQEGVVHRDIKPSNVILDRQRRVKITDFGLAKALAFPSVTSTGEILGSPEYLSPEQYRGEAVDARVDVYALGLVLYQMITGRPAFQAADPASLMFRILNDPPPAPHTLAPHIPPGLESIILRCLAKEPHQRYADAAQLLSALESVPRQSLQQVAPPPLAQAERPLPRRKAPSFSTPRRQGPTLAQPSLSRQLWQILLIVSALGLLYGGQLFVPLSIPAKVGFIAAVSLTFSLAAGITLGSGAGALTGGLLAVAQIWLPLPFPHTPGMRAVYLAANLVILVLAGMLSGVPQQRRTRFIYASILFPLAFAAYHVSVVILIASIQPAIRPAALLINPASVIYLLLGYFTLGLLLGAHGLLAPREAPTDAPARRL